MAMQGNQRKSEDGGSRKKSGPPSELSSLDFTGGGDAWALAQCAEKVQVLEGGDALMAVAEEASMLFASGQDEEAAQVLEATLDGAVGDEAGEGLWLMLLDLHRLAGDRQRFDQRGATYSARFDVDAELGGMLRPPIGLVEGGPPMTMGGLWAGVVLRLGGALRRSPSPPS